VQFSIGFREGHRCMAFNGSVDEELPFKNRFLRDYSNAVVMTKVFLHSISETCKFSNHVFQQVSSLPWP